MSHPIETVMLQHNKVQLALHRFCEGDPEATPLLQVHGLGESAAPPGAPWDQWRGPIWGLDLTGHGQSTVPQGGGYVCEVLMSDIDIALSHIGPATVHGRGLGAYLTLLLAGARPDLVRGAILGDGPGLAGGGSGVASSSWFDPADADGRTPDPFALFELSTDVRPADYAQSFVHLLMATSPLDTPLVVTARSRPLWLDAVAREPGVVVESAIDALTRFDQLIA